MSDSRVLAIVMARCLAWNDWHEAGKIAEFPKARIPALDDLIELRGQTSDPRVGPAQAPGYVVLPVANRRVQVPFHLVDGVPDDEKFLQLFELADHVRLSDQSQICISGSSVFLGRIDEIADIDFCEYVRVAPVAVKSTFALRCVSVAPTLFVKGKVDKFEFVRSGRPSHEQAVTKVAKDTRVKLDYVCLREPFLLPLSNVSLFVDLGTPSASIRGRSWAFQEIALGENAPMFPLTKPELIGQYMAWVRGEVDYYLQTGKKHYDPFKALKRALSLCRVMGFPQIQSEELYQLLRGSVLAVVRRRESLEEALGMAKKVADDGGRQAVKQLKTMLDKEPPKPDAAAIKEGRRICHDSVVRFRAEVDKLVETASHTLDLAQ